jgi:hypothetical protein
VGLSKVSGFLAFDADILGLQGLKEQFFTYIASFGPHPELSA